MGVISECCVLLLVFAAGCTKKVNECSADSDCKDVAYPFCDVDGQYAASGGDHNVCTIVPPDCPVERCGCAAGAVTCTEGLLSTCASDGKSTSMSTCDLGCATSGDRCLSFKPSNGLDVAMSAATGEPDAAFSLGVTIDTDACEVVDSTHLMLGVKTLPLPQTSAPGICAIIAKSFDIGDVTATGSRALAFVAPGPIRLHGKVDLASRDRFMGSLNAGPGAVTLGACVPADGGAESGGAGNATNGGDGLFFSSVPVHRLGGLAQTNFTPLIGGCQGGGPVLGGGGGGALQIDSYTSITLDAQSLVALGAAGGANGGGGGSGGTVVLEAPVVTIAGAIASNGGGGGLDNSTCPGTGADATNDNQPALGGTGACAVGVQGGAGGTAAAAAQNGTVNGGGGGSVGRILIRTADGTFTGPGPIFSIVPTLDTLLRI